MFPQTHFHQKTNKPFMQLVYRPPPAGQKAFGRKSTFSQKFEKYDHRGKVEPWRQENKTA